MTDVRYESDGRIAVVTIDRPTVRNAIDRPTADLLVDAFRRFESDDALHVAVLTGANGAFCAGADLKAIASGNGNRIAEDGDGPLGVTRLLLAKPVIAAVEGCAVAGGLELALWCDLRVAATDAVFGVFCRRWGVPLMDGGTVRLPRLIGMSHALDMILTGRPVSGEEALHMGLANRLVPPGQTLATALDLARDIARWPQVCMRSDRHAAYVQWQLDLDAALLSETRHGVRVVQSGEMFGGIDQFRRTVGRQGSARHFVLGTPIEPPFPPEFEVALFAMGPFQEAERRFWQTEGVYTTAVGYVGGESDPIEAVRVVFDPGVVSYESLLAVFWDGHDATIARPAARQHSAIYAQTETQRAAAERSRAAQQQILSAAGHGEITTQVLAAAAFELADDALQQCLAKQVGERHAAPA